MIWCVWFLWFFFMQKTQKELFLKRIWFFFFLPGSYLKNNSSAWGWTSGLIWDFWGHSPGLQLLLQEDKICEQNKELQIVLWSIWEWNSSVSTSVAPRRMKCGISLYLCALNGFPLQKNWNPMSHFSHSWESDSLGKRTKIRFCRVKHELFITSFCAWTVHETNT